VDDGGRERLSRRVLLRQAAKVGGTIAWTIPLIQTVDIRAAAALSGSAPPSEPLPDSEPQVGDLGGGGGAPTPSLLEITELATAPNPLRLKRDNGLRIRGFVSQAAVVQVMITRADKVVRRLLNGQMSAAGWISASWDGKGRRGRKVRPGRYAVVVVGEDGSGAIVKATLSFRVTS
jgi:FlgD Ig-like domain